MEIIQYNGRLFEITMFASVGDDPLTLECADMATDGGLLFTIIRDSDGHLLLNPRDRPIPVDLIQLVEPIADRELPRSED